MYTIVYSVSEGLREDWFLPTVVLPSENKDIIITPDFRLGDTIIDQ